MNTFTLFNRPNEIDPIGMYNKSYIKSRPRFITSTHNKQNPDYQLIIHYFK